jgi:radical SAM superfamily enzyme YgiQ (UPF0313 family)
MDVLLISIQKDLDTIGIKYLHYYLLKHNYNSSLLFLPNYDPNNDNKLKHIRKFVIENSPKLIGISLISLEYNNARHLTKYLKDNFKLLPIVWGGIHPTIAPEMCLEYADYVCIGEGERTLLNLTHAIVNNGGNNLAQVKNLCYKKNDHIKRNELYPLLDNLDEIPSYDHIPINSYIQNHEVILPIDKNIFRKFTRYSGTTYSIMSSRGCPFSCTYCCNNFISRLYNSRKVRRRSIKNIISELAKAISDNPYIEYINFQDDCFLACSNEYLNEFCESYKKEISMPFIARSIPIYINREKIQSLKSAGLAWISLGLQSGSDHVCKEIYKRKSFKADFLKAAKIIKDYNIAAYYDVILDNPFESEEDKIETIKTLAETPKPYYTQFFSLSLYFGTELYERAQKECPERIENSLEKDYWLYKKNVLNDMIRIATFIDGTKIKRIVHLYKKNPESLRFRGKLFILKLMSSLLLEPLTYFQVIKLSQRGSYIRTLRVLRYYFDEGIMRYIIQFKR